MTAWVSCDLATQTRKTRQPIFDLLRFFIHSRPHVGAKHTRITALVFARSGWVLSKILADSCGALRILAVRILEVRCGAVRCGGGRAWLALPAALRRPRRGRRPCRRHLAPRRGPGHQGAPAPVRRRRLAHPPRMA